MAILFYLILFSFTMFLKAQETAPRKWLTVALVAFALSVALIPDTSLKIFSALAFLIFAGHFFLKEKMILVFLAVRPTLDYWRDAEVIRYDNHSLNVNSAVAIIFLGWMILMLFDYWREFKLIPTFRLMAAACLIFIASSFWSAAPFTTITESIKFVTLMALFCASFIFVKHKKITTKEFFFAIVISAVAPIALAFFQAISSEGLTSYDIQNRVFGTLAHPNVLAFFLLFILILHINYSSLNPSDFWQQEKWVKRALYAILIALIFLTYTRASWIGLAVFLIVIGALSYRRYLKLTFFLVIAYLLFFPINDAIKNYTNFNLQQMPLVSRLTSRDEDADSLAWRMRLDEESIPIILNRPMFGYGYGTFPIVWEQNRGIDHLYDDSAESHNDYLRLALENGAIGLSVYVVLLVSLLFRSLQMLGFKQDKKKEYIHLAAWIAVFMVISVSDNMLHHTPVMWMMWAYWGALFATVPASYNGPNFLLES